MISGRSIPMKKTYRIEVDCANCANKMEFAASKIPGVEKVTVSFMAQKMILECDENRYEEILAQIKEAVKSVEKDCVVK